MSYRIKVPAKTLQVDEAHLLSGLEHQLHRLLDGMGVAGRGRSSGI